ncbi:MAG TPA: site-specific integrase [Firmicutes bacterium]|nr:site-specific integrase [Bacillota bacterium]
MVHKALGQAVKWGLIARNVADLVDPPRKERKEMKTLPAAEVVRLLNEAQRTGRHALYLMAVTTGLREGEILGLRWSDVDLERGIITVQQSLKKAGKEVVFASVNTSKGVRPVVITQSLVQALKSHKAKQAEERLFYGPAYRDYNLVFTVPGGGPISPPNLLRQFKSLLRKAVLPDIRFHDLRHTHAPLFLAQGVPSQNRLRAPGPLCHQCHYGYL